MKRYALLGEGISYTRSPKLHAIISDVTGHPCRYDVLDTPKEGVTDALDLLWRDYDGFNVTKPYKQAIPLSGASEEARRIGAVNTVVTRTRTGYNTDARALREAMRQEGMLPAKDQSVLVLGVGGAARSAIDVLRGCRLTVANRSLRKAEEACRALGVTATVLDRASVTGSFDLIVNATTLGL